MHIQIGFSNLMVYRLFLELKLAMIHCVSWSWWGDAHQARRKRNRRSEQSGLSGTRAFTRIPWCWCLSSKSLIISMIRSITETFILGWMVVFATNIEVSIPLSPPNVTTPLGFVVGRSFDTFNEFLGIPYATPPVGDLRWQRPQPVSRYEIRVRSDSLTFQMASFRFIGDVIWTSLSPADEWHYRSCVRSASPLYLRLILVLQIRPKIVSIWISGPHRVQILIQHYLWCSGFMGVIPFEKAYNVENSQAAWLLVRAHCPPITGLRWLPLRMLWWSQLITAWEHSAYSGQVVSFRIEFGEGEREREESSSAHT